MQNRWREGLMTNQKQKAYTSPSENPSKSHRHSFYPRCVWKFIEDPALHKTHVYGLWKEQMIC